VAAAVRKKSTSFHETNRMKAAILAASLQFEKGST